jgi:hypothetical protein
MKSTDVVAGEAGQFHETAAATTDDAEKEKGEGDGYVHR